MKFQLGLVQANDQIGVNVLLPYSIGILWEYANTDSIVKKNWQLQSIIYKKSDIKSTAKKLASNHMVCFSNYIWNFDYHLDLAREIKQQNPSCYIVFGGPQIHSRFPNFWKSYSTFVDLAILGEGENSFKELLQSWPNCNLETLSGAWSPDFQNGDAPRVQNVNEIPSPYLNGFYDEIIKLESQQGNSLQAVLQTNRGCPYHCSFCEEGSEYKNKMFFFHTSQIMNEIKWFGENNIEFVTVADDNFGIADRDVDIMKEFCNTKLQFGFPKILDCTFAKNNPKNVLEIARIDKELGTEMIRSITVALQSQNEKSLTSVKRFNLIPQKQVEFLQGLRDLGVPTYAEMIWPLPYETYDTFCNGIDKVIAQGLNTWIGVYPLSINYSSDMYLEHHENYTWSQDSIQDSKEAASHYKMNLPMSSRWVTHDTLVQGHVFYMWLANLYMFGFARPIIDHLVTSRGMSVSQVVNYFIKFCKTSKNKWLKDLNELYYNYWSCWVSNKNTPNLSVFKEENVEFWYPYTFMASALQKDHDKLMLSFEDFLADFESNLDVRNDCLWRTRNGVLRFSVDYPYVSQGFEISSKKPIPKFASLHEFCRYYYWWNRKKGLTLTVIKSI